MTITSLNFFCFLAITVFIYYLFPKKLRWISVLIFSTVFFCLFSLKVAFVFLFDITITYIGARLIAERIRTSKGKRIVLILSIAAIMSFLFVLKYINIIPNTINLFGRLFQINLHIMTINLIAPIGISYFTLSMWSYLVDVYRTTETAEKNYFKLMLFGCYYPCLISGPFIRYPEMKKEFFQEKDFDWNNVFSGFHRVVYGVFKKLLIADNLAMSVDMIFSDTGTYSGLLVLWGVILYAIQIYCDFSGCMDIVIGASRMYGIKLPENFESPFFSRKLPEFWRRWHITLGLWGKEYIMYPLLKSNAFQGLGKKAKKKWGKKTGKKIPVIISIFILWLFIGIWHGAYYHYIFAAGILPWIYFTCSELFSDPIEKLTKRLYINTETFSFHLFQSLRTITLMLCIWLFALAPNLKSGFDNYKNMLLLQTNWNVIKDHYFQYVQSAQSSMLALWKPHIILFALFLVTLVDYLKYAGIDVSERFNKQAFWLRWFVLFFMMLATLIYGVYGPGYDPRDFIYGGF